MAVTSTIPPGARSSSPCSAASGPPNRCCDSGRPLFTDPSTGQTICSCQHEQMLNYQRLAQASLIGHGGAMQLSMYNSAYPDGMPPGYLPGVGSDQSHFYPNLVSLLSQLKFHFYKYKRQSLVFRVTFIKNSNILYISYILYNEVTFFFYMKT